MPHLNPAGSPPGALQAWDEIRRQLADRTVAVWLDYDGTLSPIVARPELATMPGRTAALIDELGQRTPVGIVTGRGMADIRTKVPVAGLFYAANHGFEIVGPNCEYCPAPELRDIFDDMGRRFAPLVASIDGLIVESKGFSIAAHVRLVDDARVPEVEAFVDALVDAQPQTRKTLGKKLFEIRPRLIWHKGSAVVWLTEHLERTLGRAMVPLFIGDDRTDEDALEVVRDRGVGIRVGGPCPWQTAARWSLRDPDEVADFLAKLRETV
jgi:trehalose-phosphatase